MKDLWLWIADDASFLTLEDLRSRLGEKDLLPEKVVVCLLSDRMIPLWPPMGPETEITYFHKIYSRYRLRTDIDFTREALAEWLKMHHPKGMGYPRTGP